MRLGAVVLTLLQLVSAAACATEPPSSSFAGLSVVEAVARLQDQGLAIVYSSALVRPDMLVAPQEGRAHGAELLLRHDSGKLVSWWLSYAAARAEDFIDGSMLPRSWDQRHAASFGLNLSLPRSWNVNLAGTTTLHGTIAGMGPDQAPEIVLAGCGLEVTRGPGTLVVGRLGEGAGPGS